MVDGIPEQAKHQWYIGRINVEFRKRVMEQLDSVRNLRRLSIAFSGKRPPIRPRVVLANMRLRPRQLYSYENHLESIEKVNAMGIYSMVDFQFTPRDTLPTCDTLDLKLSCVFDKPYDFYVETRASGSSVGRLGPELVVGLSKRNAFRGGEKLDVALHGSYAWQINGGSNNYYEYGFEASVEFPAWWHPSSAATASVQGVVLTAVPVAVGSSPRQPPWHASATTSSTVRAIST